jgi:LmbE family N-acetylglucosaminyl deacetylase
MFRRLPLVASTLAALSFASLACATPAPAPLSPAEIGEELRALGTVGSVLHVAAHPDDENTELITFLSRGRHYRTGYLSLTRGDGGQNELGRDFDEKLGLLRTHELLAARQLDRGQQFFTRAIDFGFSKTPEETLTFWNKKEVLGDVVRVIRQFRPDVIVTRFPIPPGSGGHGHHTASGMLSVEAFKLAGDPTAYPEQLAEGLTPWQPRRLLWNVFRFTPGSTLPLPGTPFTQDIAGKDVLTGEEFGTIAAHSRAMHKTQGLGGFAMRARTGPNSQSFLLLAGEPATNDVMEGIDTTWARYPGGAEIATALAQILADYKSDTPAASVPALLKLRTQLAALPTDAVIADKRAQLDRIVLSALGVRVSTNASTAEVIPGGTVRLTFAALANSPGVAYVGVRTPFTQLKFARADLSANAGEPPSVVVLLPADLPLSHPYWLREPGAAGISTVSDPSLIGRPENPPVIPVTHVFDVGGQQIEVADEPVHATTDARGEIRRLVAVAPVAIAFDSEIYYAAPATAKTVRLTLTAARAAAGTLQLALPTGWSATPAQVPFRFAAAGEKAEFSFVLHAPAASSAGAVTATVAIDGRTYSHQRLELRYAHLPPLLLQARASVRLVSFDLALRAQRIGYLPGAGDYVAECLAQMGANVRLLTGADLTPEKLAGLDAVVIGVRAFNERTDLKDNLPGLFAWVEQGGTVIAQYNRPNGLNAPTLAPFALSIEGPAPALRVTEENAAVTALLPAHPALTTPNRLVAADWDGWVQERGAYFPSKWDESRFVAPLAMNDTGEKPLQSSLLIARHGKGHYVYTGLAFFRQLPAGNPGAWRLFANLVSLPAE